MTTATLATGNRTMDTAVRPRRSLEELVDRLIETLFPAETDAAEQTATRTIHKARRLRQAGDVDAALGVLAGMGMAKTGTREARWVFSEWKSLVKRRFGDREVLVYTQSTGSASALVPNGDGTLEVAAVLGMRWRPGKVVSERSLRGLRPLGRLAFDPGLETLSSPIGGTADLASPGRTLLPLAPACLGRVRR